jgi:nucleolar protein 53
MLTFSKKSKKSKHGKKNWRKNIDVSDIEQTQQKINQQQIKNQKISDLKNTDLFELDDNLDNANIKPKKFLGKKTKKPKKVSKMEQRQIKHIIESSKTKAVLNNLDKDKNQNENKIYDLWENDNKNIDTNTNKNNNATLKLKYPKVPIPHPGQSYNPKKKDLNKLLATVVENNKYLIPSPEPSSESENHEWDEESEEITKPVANNEPVSDLNRLTNKQKKLKEKKKANKLINRQQEQNKRIKVAISNILGMKKFEREKKTKEEENAKKNLEEKKKEKIKNYEIKKGIINDKELLEDFQVNKEPVPLRKMREDINPLSERWENIMKRNMIGEYSNKIRKTGNRKLKKVKFMDIDGPIEYDENINNFQIIE